MNSGMRFPKPATEVCLSVMQKPEELLENRRGPSIGPSGRREGREFRRDRVIGFFLNFYKGYSSAIATICQ